MKFKTKPTINLSFLKGLQKPFLCVANFFGNLIKSYLLMSKPERIMAIVLICGAVIFSSLKFYYSYLDHTVAAADIGGKYHEVVVGEIKFLNPIAAQNETEKAVSRLIFSGLVQVIDQNRIESDLARSYEVSPDGLVYTFHLREDAHFSDGNPVTANDVAYTIDSIKAPESKSPLQKTWSGVAVSVIDDLTLELRPPNVYGPFIYNCNFGVMPAHLTSDEFAKQLVGSGPYRYKKATKESLEIKEINLTRSESYYGMKPYIRDLKITFASDKSKAQTLYEKDEDIDAIYGTSSSIGQKYDYVSSRRLALLVNLRLPQFQDASLRQGIFGTEVLATPVNLSLTTLDLSPQKEKAQEIQREFQARNINLEITYLNPIKYQEAIHAKNYALLLHGFDFGYDRDPYKYWHSSQMGEMNLTGWSQRESDILLEDARMIIDGTERNKKYDQFYDSIAKENIIHFSEPIVLNFSLKDTIKGERVFVGNQPYSRYLMMNKWYVTEKRVQK